MGDRHLAEEVHLQANLPDPTAQIDVVEEERGALVEQATDRRHGRPTDDQAGGRRLVDGQNTGPAPILQAVALPREVPQEPAIEPPPDPGPAEEDPREGRAGINDL